MDDLSTLLTDPAFAGGYNQIPLTKQSIYPLKDLQATGGLDRLPIFPDDLLPTLSMLYALDTEGNPQTLQCETDKALDVFVVNSSGGGGSTAPLKSRYQANNNSWSGLSFSGSHTQFSATPGGANQIFRAQFSFWFDLTGVTFPKTAEILLWMGPQTNVNNGPYLFSQSFGFFSSAPAAGVQVGGTVEVPFLPAWDIATQYGPNTVMAFVIQASAGTVWWSGTVEYI